MMKKKEQFLFAYWKYTNGDNIRSVYKAMTIDTSMGNRSPFRGQLDAAHANLYKKLSKKIAVFATSETQKRALVDLAINHLEAHEDVLSLEEDDAVERSYNLVFNNVHGVRGRNLLSLSSGITGMLFHTKEIKEAYGGEFLDGDLKGFLEKDLATIHYDMEDGEGPVGQYVHSLLDADLDRPGIQIADESGKISTSRDTKLAANLLAVSEGRGENVVIVLQKSMIVKGGLSVMKQETHAPNHFSPVVGLNEKPIIIPKEVWQTYTLTRAASKQISRAVYGEDPSIKFFSFSCLSLFL